MILSPGSSRLVAFLDLQNIAVRKYLERRAKEKEQDEKEAKEMEKKQQASSAVPGYPNGDFPGVQHQAPVADEPSSSTSKSKKKKGMWGFSSRSAKSDTAAEEEPAEADLYHSPRPAFYAHARPSRRNQIPRDVAVPYFRFRKDRFYDWPPDPTVSRATPIFTSGGVGGRNEDGLSDFSIHKGNTDYDSGMDQGGMRQRGRKQRGQMEDEDYGYG